MAHDVIDNPADLSPAWLSARLEVAGNPARCTALEVRRTVEATSATVLFIRAELVEDGRDPRRADLALKRFRPEWLAAGINEALLYHDLALRGPVPAPVSLDCALDDDAGYCHLLLPDLTATHRPCSQRFSPDDLAQVIDALADFHRAWWDAPALSDPLLSMPHTGTVRFAQALPEPDLARDGAWLLDDAIPAAVDQLGAMLPPEWVRLFESAAAAWPALYGPRTRAGGLALIHGDCHWENVFLPLAADAAAQQEAPAVSLIDWEACKRAPAAYDLAYLLISARSAARRREIEADAIAAYHARLGRADYARDQLELDYRLSIFPVLFAAIAWRRLQAMHDAVAAFRDWDCAALAS